jgi:hypothetical protein
MLCLRRRLLLLLDNDIGCLKMEHVCYVVMKSYPVVVVPQVLRQGAGRAVIDV